MIGRWLLLPASFIIFFFPVKVLGKSLVYSVYLRFFSHFQLNFCLPIQGIKQNDIKRHFHSQSLSKLHYFNDCCYCLRTHTHTKRSCSLLRIKGKYCNEHSSSIFVSFICVLHLNFDLSGWQELWAVCESNDDDSKKEKKKVERWRGSKLCKSNNCIWWHCYKYLWSLVGCFSDFM